MERNEKFLREHLADNLVFRRASGQLVNKETYLAELVLPDNTYEFIHSEDVEVLVYDEDTALVSLRVWAKGKRSGTLFEGMYRNTRLFLKKQGKWQCAVWFNTPEKI